MDPGRAAGGAGMARGRHSCISCPQTHVDSVSLALPTLVKVRQHDMRVEKERKSVREHPTMMDRALNPPLLSLPLRRLVTFQ